jgi:hypothetical protein
MVNFALQVGQTQQTVTVEGQVSQVETQSTSISKEPGGICSALESHSVFLHCKPVWLTNGSHSSPALESRMGMK